jgi:hydrogenase small subunit
MGTLPGVPRLRLHNPVLAYENGDEFLEIWHKAANGILKPFLLVVEGSIPNEELSGEGTWAAFGTDAATGQPIPTTRWIDRLARHAWALVAAGTCSAYGGIHAMTGNPTGAMGLPDDLGWDWRSESGLPIVCVPGCPVQPDNFMETLLYLMRQLVGQAPPIPLDNQLRPTWLFGQTVHEGCDRGGYYEQADFAQALGQSPCIIKLGCWGPVVQCNVGKRGWMSGIGGCLNVGGICIGCTMPGFPDKFMPFMDEPSGVKLSTTAVQMYGRTTRALRMFTKESLSHEPNRPRRSDGPSTDPLSGDPPTRERKQPCRASSRRSSRCRGIRSPGSSEASAFIQRLTSTPGGLSNATARLQSSGGIACS